MCIVMNQYPVVKSNIRQGELMTDKSLLSVLVSN
jgi:hypothetical protein